MPLFFIVSGYFFHPARYPRFVDFLKSRVLTLVVPYLFFLAVAALYNWWQGPPTWWGDALKGRPGGSLWFLQVLFSAEIVFYEMQNIFPSALSA